MVSAPYERKNGKPMKIAVLAVKACISKSILPTYGRFSRARSHMTLSDRILPYQQLSTKNASRNNNNVAYRHQYAVVKHTNASIFAAERLTMTEGTLKCVENILLLEFLV